MEPLCSDAEKMDGSDCGTLRLLHREIGGLELHILLTGPGAAAVQRSLREYLSIFRPELCLNAGTAAGFHGEAAGSGPYSVGRVCEVLSGACLNTAEAEQADSRCLVTLPHVLQSVKETALLRERFAADLADMEAWYILLECYRNNLPCRIWKSVSDNGTGISRKEFKRVLPGMAEALSNTVLHYIQTLGRNV